MAGRGTGYRALDWAWSLPIGPSTKIVLLALAGRADQAYSCWPSLSLLIEETGLSRTSVKRALTILEQNDYLMRASRQRANGSSTSNRYYLNHPEAPHVTGEIDLDDESGVIEELQRAARRAIEGGP